MQVLGSLALRQSYQLSAGGQTSLAKLLDVSQLDYAAGDHTPPMDV